MKLTPADLDKILAAYDSVADPKMQREVAGHFVMESIIMREALDALARYKDPAVRRIAKAALKLADE